MTNLSPTVVKSIFGASLLTVFALTSVGCCYNFNADRDEKLRKLRREYKLLRAEKVRLTRAQKDWARLARRQNEPVIVATATASDIQKAIKQSLPLSFSASKLHKLVSGTVTITGISNLKVSAKGVSLVLSGRGKKLKVNHSGAGFTTLDDEIIAGLTAGITMNLSGKAGINGDGDLVWIGKVSRVKLKKQNKHAGKIKKAVNDYAFGGAHRISISDIVQGQTKLGLVGAVSSKNKLVLGFM